jgi:hypothetical protein
MPRENGLNGGTHTEAGPQNRNDEVFTLNAYCWGILHHGCINGGLDDGNRAKRFVCQVARNLSGQPKKVGVWGAFVTELANSVSNEWVVDNE